MTYSHEQNPWKIAQSTDWLLVQLMAMASAEPKLIPPFTTSVLTLYAAMTHLLREDATFIS